MLLKLAKHRLFKDTLVLLGVQISGYVLPLITLPYLTRVLGPGNFGLVALGSAFALYFYVVVEYGFAITGTRAVAIAEGDLVRISRIYSSVMTCKLMLLVLCFMVLLISVATVPALRQHWLLYLVSFLQVVGWGLSPNWVLQGMQRMRLIAYSDYTAKIVSVLMIFLLVRNREDYLRAAALQAGGFVISALVGLFMLFGTLRVRLVRPDWSEMVSAMTDGWPIFLSMASMIVVTSTNTMILGMVTTPEQVGFLSAAQRLVIAARALTNPVTTAIYPHMSKMAAKSRSAGVAFLEKQLIWTALPFLFITLGMLVFGPLASRILYGQRFAETGLLLQLMSPTPFIHAVSMCFGTYYMLAFGFEKEWSKIITRMMILNFVLLALLIPVMLPVRAVAVTSTLLDVFSATSAYLFYRKTVGRTAASNRESAENTPAVS